MKRAVIYARVSTDDQAEKGYSLPTQIEAMQKYAREKGMKIVRELQDDYSGAKLDRPALDILREMIERKEADAIIIYAADRLSRNLAHLLILRDEFNRAGIELHYANRGKSEDTAESRLLENVEGVIAEFEREKIRERTRRGKIAKAKAGKWVGAGRPPYGFRQVGKGADARLERDEMQAATVRRIVDMVLGRNGYQPMGITTIINLLNNEGVPTAYGARGWRTGTLRPLLRGKQLLGIFTSYGSVLHFPHLAILDEETWGEVQAMLDHNSRLHPNNRQYPYLFSGFARCRCGKGLSGLKMRSFKIKRKIRRYEYHYYTCQTRAEGRLWHDCKEGMINVEVLEPLIWNWLVDLLTDEAKLEKGIHEFVANRENELKKMRERRETTENLIRRADKQIEQLTTDLREFESESARAAIKKEIDRIGNERDSLVAMLDTLDAHLGKRELGDAEIETIRETARVIRARLAGKPTYEEKRALFRLVNLEIKVQYGENGRELSVTCGLGTETLKLPARKNYGANNSSSTAKIRARIFESPPDVRQEICSVPSRVPARVQNTQAIHHARLD